MSSKFEANHCIYCDHVKNNPQTASLCFGGLGIPECMGSNPGHGLSGDWAFTWVNSSKIGGLSDRRSPVGDLL